MKFNFSLLLIIISSYLGLELVRRRVQAGVQVYQCGIPGTFALTFDDGPYIYTKQLLGILRRLKARVTFFVVGEMVDNNDYGPVLKEMAQDGHQIASHSYTHPHMNEINNSSVEDEIVKSNRAIEHRIGKKTTYFRCPYGECDERVLTILAQHDLRVINWGIDTLDWTGKSPKEIIKVYNDDMNQAEANKIGFISLQHDIHPNSVAVVSRIIKIIRDKGFYLTTVAECLGETF